ncbi:hypothetical protein EVG20_g5239 [Dentipellis fragilis]|uniref:Uncharacterized protein n=1 Tax=Dentipellis fragilis TaxID=205917 RepID=A0A4Y9YVZ6_9AGAM|nr:hypothetical protein EVG20_g5239 [Dentipellis fragilis]
MCIVFPLPSHLPPPTFRPLSPLLSSPLLFSHLAGPRKRVNILRALAPLRLCSRTLASCIHALRASRLSLRHWCHVLCARALPLTPSLPHPPTQGISTISPAPRRCFPLCTSHPPTCPCPHPRVDAPAALSCSSIYVWTTRPLVCTPHASVLPRELYAGTLLSSMCALHLGGELLSYLSTSSFTELYFRLLSVSITLITLHYLEI